MKKQNKKINFLKILCTLSSVFVISFNLFGCKTDESTTKNIKKMNEKSLVSIQNAKKISTDINEKKVVLVPPPRGTSDIEAIINKAILELVYQSKAEKDKYNNIIAKKTLSIQDRRDIFEYYKNNSMTYKALDTINKLYSETNDLGDKFNVALSQIRYGNYIDARNTLKEIYYESDRPGVQGRRFSSGGIWAVIEANIG